MINYATLVTENRRLAMLRFLEAQADYTSNLSVLQGVLETIGHGVSRDVLRTDAAWLAEQGLAEHREIDGTTVEVVKITSRGVDAALGRAVVPGVARPAPGQ